MATGAAAMVTTALLCAAPPLLALRFREQLEALLAGSSLSSVALATWWTAVVLLRGGAVSAAVQRVYAARDVGAALRRGAFRLVRRVVPAVRQRVASESAAAVAKVRSAMLHDTASCAVYTALPPRGLPPDALLAQLRTWAAREKANWSGGAASGAVYHGGERHLTLLGNVYSLFALSNPLHPELFPFTRKMEADVVRMSVTAFGGDAAACGTITSGGTESILLACKAYRDRARAERGIDAPEIVAPITVHAAFEKAANLFGMRLVHVPVQRDTMTVRIDDVRAALTANTVLVVGSAPNFPHGVVDPIVEMAALAAAHGIGFHTDACLGSMLVPFAQLPHAVDFRVAGVTSVSMDLHKYGFAPKGASVIMYRDAQLRRFQYFCSTSWTGGIYATPTLAGSRAGALSATCWAAMLALGEQGYRDAATAILDAAAVIRAAVDAEPNLTMLGKPSMSVVAFAAADPARLNVYDVAEAMTKRGGWHLNCLQNPAAVHMCVTYLHRGDVARRFAADLRAAVADVLANPSAFANGVAAVYGMKATLPDTSIVDDIVHRVVDTFFMP